MNGKGDGRLHDRTQIGHKEMQLRWKLAFDGLTEEEAQLLEHYVHEREKLCTTQQS